MTKFYTNIFSILNIYKRPSKKSEVVSQMIFGDSFSISKKTKQWIKIKTKEDNYNGYILNKNYSEFLKPTHKIDVLKANVYKYPNKLRKINEIPFNSKIKVTGNNNKFLKFSKGWINKNQVKEINYIEKNPFRKINIFKNTKYKWGGKSYKGIDCSALIQVCLNFNNKYCPRDTKDQIKFCNKKKGKNYSKGDIIFWKGHVGICLDKSKFIHAYGPKKKVIIMSVNYAVKLIERTAKLLIKKVSNVENY